jgi:hypothetical protein
MFMTLFKHELLERRLVLPLSPSGSKPARRELAAGCGNGVSARDALSETKKYQLIDRTQYLIPTSCKERVLAAAKIILKWGLEKALVCTNHNGFRESILDLSFRRIA